MNEPKDMDEAKALIERLRKEIASTAIKEAYAGQSFRARVYVELLREMKAEFGEKKAREVFFRATKNCGEKMCKEFFGVENTYPLPKFKDMLLGSYPAGGALHKPEVVRCNEEELVVCMHDCPVKQAWRSFGLDREEVKEMCYVADGWDHGMFGSMYDFYVDYWHDDPKDCCTLHMKSKKR